MTPSQKAEGESRERLAAQIAKAVLDAYWKDPRRLEAANAAVLALLPSAPAPADAAGLVALLEHLHERASFVVPKLESVAAQRSDQHDVAELRHALHVAAAGIAASRLRSQPALPAEAVAGLVGELELIGVSLGGTYQAMGRSVLGIAARLRSLSCGTAGAERAEALEMLEKLALNAHGLPVTICPPIPGEFMPSMRTWVVKRNDHVRGEGLTLQAALAAAGGKEK